MSWLRYNLGTERRAASLDSSSSISAACAAAADSADHGLRVMWSRVVMDFTCP
eukprot:COSAG02_NODE_315_length_24910_cov_17.139978_14_plen_53_part_00